MAELSTTITKLRVTHNPVPWGQGFSVSAHITPAGHHHVHGDVEFFADGETLGRARTDSTGVAAIGVPGGLVKPGPHEMTARFHGDGYNAASDSEPLVVNLAPAEGDPWPSADEVEKFRGSKPVVDEPKVEPVVVRQEPIYPVSAEEHEFPDRFRTTVPPALETSPVDQNPATASLPADRKPEMA